MSQKKQFSKNDIEQVFANVSKDSSQAPEGFFDWRLRNDFSKLEAVDEGRGLAFRRRVGRKSVLLCPKASVLTYF